MTHLDQASTQGIVGEPHSPPTICDQLKMKRARLAQDMKKRLRALDRQIELLEGSNAEQLVKDAEKALWEEN